MSLAQHGTAPAPVSLRPITITEPTASRAQHLAGLLVVVGVAIVPLIFSSSFTAIGIHSNESDVEIRYRYLYGMVREVISLGLLAYVVRQNRQRFADFGMVFRFSDIAFGIFLWAVALCCYDLAYPSLLGFCETLGWHRSAANVPAYRLSGLLAVGYVVISPVFEEMIVRAFVMTELIALTGSSVIAALVSVLLQTSYHFYQGLPYALCASVIFLVFAVYYARTRRIIPVIFAHLIWDISAFLSHAGHRVDISHS